VLRTHRWGLGLTRALLLAALLIQGWYAVGQEEEEIVLTSDTDYQKVAALVDVDGMAGTIRTLAGYGSRVTGYPGCEKAAAFVETRFRELGLEDVRAEEFPVVVPLVEKDEDGRAASLTIVQASDVATGRHAAAEGKSFEVLPLWPNLVRTPMTPPEGLTGRLIYGGTGNVRMFNGQDVAGSIVLLDFNCGSGWFNAPLLGAKAVLFIEPEETIRGEAEQKFLSMPVNIPRYWVPKETADYLLGLLAQADEVEIGIKCRMRWHKIPNAKNIVGTIKGSHPRLNKQQVVIQAYYDSISIAPPQAPGAENACSIAALFEVIKAFKAQPPKRTVMFVATAGHFQGMAGTKHFIRQRIRGARSDPTVRAMFALVNEGRTKLEETAERVWGEEGREEEWLSEEQRIEEQLRGLGGMAKAVRVVDKKVRKLERVIEKGRRIEDPNRGKLTERKLTAEELEDRRELITMMSEAVGLMQEGIQRSKEALARRRDVARDGDIAQKKELLAEVKDAVEGLVDALDFSNLDISLWFAIDLSSHNDTFGIFYKGHFYNYSESIQWKFSDVGKKAREYGDLIARALSVERAARLVDGINAIQGKSWQVYMAGKLGLSNEVAVLAGIPGFGLATIDDTRPWVDTPMDIPEYVEVENVADQTRFLACLLCDLVSAQEPKDLYEIELDDNFVEVKGRLVEFNPQVSTFPDDPVVQAIAVARTGMKTAMGIRAEIFDLSNPFHPEYLEREQQRREHPPETREEKIAAAADERQEKEWAGRVNLMGLANTRAKGGVVPIEGYLLSEETGEVVMAPDQGVSGAEAYPIEVTLDQEIRPVTVVMFKCKPMAIYDMVDQRFFELLSELYVYDAVRDATPYEYGYCLPVPPQELVSAYEPVAVVFAPSGMKVKVTMGASVLGLRFVLVNPTAAMPLGEGYLIDEYPSMYATPYRVASDMWRLDGGPQRLQALVEHGIKNDRVMKAHERARAELDAAEEALRLREYDKFFSAARAAWSYESRAYPQIRTTLNDVIKGILFYLALLMPFAFFTERLLIASPHLKWQIAGNVGIFVVIFLLIGLVHPAFAITFTPAIILLAFIILALTVIVVGIIVQKFEEQMKEIKYQQTGIHAADVGRLGATAAAFNLGISNMRRRKTRTLLTCLTLVLLTFTVLSFTSVVQGVRRNQIPLPKVSPYNGIMIRDKTWAPIGEPTTRIMDNEFAGSGYPVAARAWYFSSQVGEQSFVNVSRGPSGYSATAMLGLMPSESAITRPERFLLPGGRWLEPADNLVCIIPEGMAGALNIAAEQVGSASVAVFGTQMRVIGILSSSRFKNAVDLDGEPITPVDYLLMQEQQGEQATTAGGKGGKEEQLREYIHLASDSVLVVPYDFVINAGGTVRSVAIGMPDAKTVDKHMRDLMERIELNIYAGEDGRTFLVSAVGATSFTGTADLIIPILIAAAIVLNTMLGSVYERVREIYIYSSLGLAPTHVAALFIAEACVYAILGAIAGYLVGQVAVKALETLGMLQGLNLNYSSLSAVGSTVVIMATVLLSVLYPARKASDIAMPGIERRWTLPEPEGDEIAMDLPFTVTGDHAMGVNMYLHEYLAAHADYSLGQFSTADIDMTGVDSEYGEGYALLAMVWLAPYDLGVSEHVAIETVPTEDEEVYQIRVRIRRESGDDASWLRVTRNFINILRKQYLLWRTFPAAAKAEYGQRGTKLLAGETEA